VNTILGSGITVTPGSLNYTGASSASGTFTSGLTSGIGIDSGIILTSGQAADAVGPNNADNKSTGHGLPGDPSLTTLAGVDTFDASSLEFDFESTGGDLFFDFVFASEEYNEYANSNVNDTFAFFLDGVNIALIPGTNQPVSIDTVNGGNPFGTNAQNPQLFNNNDLQDGGGTFDIQYDGFTDVFTAQALGLSAGKHTIKLAIADGGDSTFDSAVFLKAGSFSDINTNPDADAIKTPESASVLGLLAVGMFGATSVLKRKKEQLAE
ncbi:MAG: choice-of-anchor L domain-containing protein, partial [Xenococcaceae cyanobacterium]